MRHPGLKARVANHKPLSARAQSFHAQTHKLVTAIPDDPRCQKPLGESVNYYVFVSGGGGGEASGDHVPAPAEEPATSAGTSETSWSVLRADSLITRPSPLNSDRVQTRK